MQKRSYDKRRTYRRRPRAGIFIMAGALIIALGAGIFFIIQAFTGQPGAPAELTPPATSALQPPESPTPTPEPSLSADLAPHAVEGETDPARFGFETKIMKGDNETDSYRRPDNVYFGAGDEYTALEGVTTFRGNNYRNAPSWDTAAISEGKLEKMREPKKTDSLNGKGGAAWTGQPLVVKWPDKLRGNMTSIYDEFRNKEGFTEVILAAYDGRIYFMDLETGDKTRDPINIGAPTKGTPSLDPRGYPIIYVGQGLDPQASMTKSDNMYFRAYSLIDGKLLYKYGYETKDPFALRGWQAYDSSPLISASADTLIWPGENGILYTVKLNTKYDENAGTVAMTPDAPVKYRYNSPANEEREKALGGRYGIENSAIAWRNYLIFTDNAGMLQCVDLNTMTTVYVNDMGNDSDVTMVLEEDPENNRFYLYTGDEYDDSVANADPGKGPCYARKIDGITGKILWEQPYTVDSSNTSVDGGILASPVLGREGTSMAGLIIYNVTAEVKGKSTTSRLVALDKLTGNQVWDYDMDVTGWSPSSPVPVYTPEGKGYLIQCDRNGDVALIDGATGEAKDVLELKVVGSDGKVKDQNNFEASPVVFGNTIIVASRTHNIFFITIK